MINPKIRDVYGNSGFEIMSGLCNTLTEEERNSIYAVDKNILSRIDGVPLELSSDRSELVDDITDKALNYMFSIDRDTILVCCEYAGEGVKVWLTTR